MQGFDNKTVELMARALDRALHMLAKNNQRAGDGAKDALAKHILELARRGERNEVRLAYIAVAKLEGEGR